MKEEKIMIVEKWLTENKYSRCGRKLDKVLGIVVHYVGANNQKPEQTVNYFESLKEGKNEIYASAHYVVGQDGKVIQCIPNDEVAYHCGALKYKEGIQEKLGSYPNYTTIGIEMCHDEKGFSEETLKSASNLCSQLLMEYKLDVGDLYRHFDITSKLCPKFFVEDESQWVAFKYRVSERLDALKELNMSVSPFSIA